MPNLAESLEYVTYYSSIAPHSLKALAILSDTTVRIYAVAQEDLKSY